jgi:hypothetical protein
MQKFLIILAYLAITINTYTMEDILPYMKLDLNKVYKYFELTSAKDFKRISNVIGYYYIFNIEIVINDGKSTIKETFHARVNI